MHGGDGGILMVVLLFIVRNGSGFLTGSLVAFWVLF